VYWFLQWVFAVVFHTCNSQINPLYHLLFIILLLYY
jgi:hypothetical protein